MCLAACRACLTRCPLQLHTHPPSGPGYATARTAGNPANGAALRPCAVCTAGVALHSLQQGSQQGTAGYCLGTAVLPSHHRLWPPRPAGQDLVERTLSLVVAARPGDSGGLQPEESKALGELVIARPTAARTLVFMCLLALRRPVRKASGAGLRAAARAPCLPA